MARKKNKKVVEEKNQVIEETPVVEIVPEKEVKEESETIEKEEVIKEPEVIEEIRSTEKKIQEGAKKREDMKLAWQKRFKNDSMTNLYSYNIGSLL